jgi:hypothetical protein
MHGLIPLQQSFCSGGHTKLRVAKSETPCLPSVVASTASVPTTIGHPLHTAPSTAAPPTRAVTGLVEIHVFSTWN